MGERGAERVLECAQLAMGLAHVRAGTRVLYIQGHGTTLLYEAPPRSNTPTQDPSTDLRAGHGTTLLYEAPPRRGDLQRRASGQAV